MKKDNQLRSQCPINFALESFGDKWSLLIVRDIFKFNKHTYGEFLSSQENIATNILANRLIKLQEVGIIEKRDEKQKTTYWLTQKGLDMYPIMKEIIAWSGKYSNKI